MEFKTVINKTSDVSVYNINNYLNINKNVDVSVISVVVLINWCLEIEARENRIKDISANILDVATTISWSVQDDELTDADVAEIKAAGGILYNDGWQGQITLPIDWQDVIDNNLVINNGCGVCPSEVEIDLNKKSYTIS